MKKNLLIFAMLMAMTGFVRAQVIADYECIPMNVMMGGADDQSSMTVVPNPDPSGINTSAYVVKFVRDKDGIPWEGFWSALPTPVDVTVNKYVHVKVWKPRISPIKFKLEGGAAGTLEMASTTAQTSTGTWEDMVFDFTSKTGTYPVIAFMPDFADPVNLTDDIVIYFDDIVVNNNPAPNSPAVYIIEDYEIMPLNYMLGPPTDLSSMTLFPNPDKSGINTSSYVIKFVRDKDGVPWGGFWSTTPVDVSTNKYMHVKVWKPRISPVKFKIEGGAAGTLEQASTGPQTSTGRWEDMVFDFTSKTGPYPIIALMPDFEDPLTLTEDMVMYFDDIILNNDPNPFVPEVIMNVDMHGSGLAAGEKVWVAGSFGGIYGTWNEPSTNPNNELTDPNNDSIYSITMSLPAGTYYYKFFKGSGWNGGEWTGDPNRGINVVNDTIANYLWGIFQPVGTGENSIAKGINVYPVPFSNVLNVETANDLASITIFSALGRQVVTMDKILKGTTVINTESFARGLYFVTFYPEKSGTPHVVKIMKF
jgi:hypothetical protein